MNLKHVVCACLLSAAVLLPQTNMVRAAESTEIEDLSRPTGDLAVRTPSKPMELLSASDVDALNEKMGAYQAQKTSLLQNKADHYYYYDHLNPTAKQIYDVLFEVCRDPVDPGNIGLDMTDMDPSGDEYYYQFNLAYRAICFDHPELFWLYSGEEANICYYSEAINQHGFYYVYFMLEKPYEDFERVMDRFNDAVDAFLADIDTGISEYETIRQVHDKLIGLVNYNDPVANDMSSFSRGQDLAHTAYGALVEDSGVKPNYCVCDGYSLAFEYLLQQCGIDVVFIAGMAGASLDDCGGHAWNVVKMDGEWYEVDSTWDDSGSIEDDLIQGSIEYEYFTEALNNQEYRDTIDHYLFLVSTERITHFPSGEEYIYVSYDQRVEINLCQESVHIRMADYEDTGKYNPDPEVIGLAPLAMQNYRPVS